MSSESEIAYEFQGFTYRFLDDVESEITDLTEVNIVPSPENDIPEISSTDPGWTEEEIRYMRYKCQTYFPQIGPKKIFSNIKQMFLRISNELGTKSLEQCEQYYRNAVKKEKQKRKKLNKNKINNVQYWTEKETNLLIDKCKVYSPQVDANILLNKREMWEKIAGHLRNRTPIQCKRHYYHIRHKIKDKAGSDPIINPNTVKLDHNDGLELKSESDQMINPKRVKLDHNDGLELKNKSDQIINPNPVKLDHNDELELKSKKARLVLNTKRSSEKQNNDPLVFPVLTKFPIQHHAVWTDKETELLINRYTEYISEIGPYKKFRIKRQMWQAIARELKNKTFIQCERHYYSTIKSCNSLPEPVKKTVLDHMKNKHQDDLITNEKLYEFIQTSKLVSTLHQSIGQVWTEDETKLLFEKYRKYASQIGPRKQFRYKKDMWKHIASEFNGSKTYQQCEQQFYRIVMKYKSSERNQMETSEQEDETNKTEFVASNDWLDYSSLGEMNTNKRWMEISKVECGKYELNETFEDFNSNTEPENDDQINQYSESSNIEYPEMTKIKVESIEISDDDLDDSNSSAHFRIEPQIDLSINYSDPLKFDEPCTIKSESIQNRVLKEPVNKSTVSWLKPVDHEENQERRQIQQDLNFCHESVDKSKTSWLKPVDPEENQEKKQIKKNLKKSPEPAKKSSINWSKPVDVKNSIETLNKTTNSWLKPVKTENNRNETIVELNPKLIDNSALQKTTYLVWTDEEVALLFHKYNQYLPQIGPQHRFRYKKDVWKQIATELKDKTFQQCEQQYYRTLMKCRINNDLATVSGRIV
ncbi:uncharacterized protein LOC129918109 [Episyrphus balteatus]|uniref:uncharacterized protein LOC129918109 n=1 Tax=Episyrphus balteatus TaxID=286459 RepID=UPI002485329A|nr:uncharacterized protein LOC129918109 [Episyrphus balteatus]XP_055854432.1 uncharacterized protein LOC129918109 [Episyrphus balteatus]XP_055854433.1 uncharacterized protein LOC129918109 [Episyrphus balteatus]